MILISNFKSYKTRNETKNYLLEINNLLKNINILDEIIVFPSAIALQNTIGQISIGSQNIYPALNGPFTGEITLQQIDEFNIEYVLIGHSERRDILNESIDFIAKKFNFLVEHNKKIVLCIGESQEIRERGETLAFLKSQLSNLNLNYKNLTIAYEPIWAIGSGLTPTLNQIEETLQFLADLTNKKIIYGGSVKLANIKEILSLSSCNGVLIGGASLNVQDFSQMIKIASSINKIRS